jgi:hypothetical protein
MNRIQGHASRGLSLACGLLLALGVARCGGGGGSSSGFDAGSDGSGATAGSGGFSGTAGAGAAGGTAGADAEAPDAPPPIDGSVDADAGAPCNAIDITGDHKSATYTGTATAVGSDALGCGPSGVPRSTLRVELEAGNYVVNVSGDTANPAAPETVVSVRTQCDSKIFELSCDSNALFLSSYFSLAKPAAVFLLVQGQALTSTFTLTLKKLSSCSCKTGQTCVASGACVDCVSADDCVPGAVCDEQGFCRYCAGDSDCLQSSSGPHCRSNGLCGCTEQSQCTAPGTVCGSQGECVPGCKLDAECSSNPSGAYCNPTTHQCGCTTDSHCTKADTKCGQTGVCIECKPGFEDCDGQAWNGCEKDTTTDPKNCGACGVSCQGALCKSGACTQASELMVADGASAIVVDDTYVYYTNNTQNSKFSPGSVKRLALSNKVVDTIVQAPTNVYWSDLAANSTHLIWESVALSGSKRELYSMVKAGSWPSLIAAYESSTTQDLIAADDTAVFVWRQYGGYRLERVPLPSGTLQNLSTEIGYYFGLTSDHVIFPNVAGTSLLSMPKAGGAASSLSSNVGLYSTVHVSGGYVYYDGSDAKTIYRMPVSGGVEEKIVTTSSQSLSGLSHFGVGGGYIYYVFWNGTSRSIARAPMAGGTETVLTQGLPVGDLAVTSTHVYWCWEDGYGGAIRRLPH